MIVNSESPLWKRVLVAAVVAITVQGIAVGARVLEYRLGISQAQLDRKRAAR